MEYKYYRILLILDEALVLGNENNNTIDITNEAEHSKFILKVSQYDCDNISFK